MSRGATRSSCGLFLTFDFGQVVPNSTSSDCAEYRMPLADVVPGNTPDHGTFDTACRLGRARQHHH